MLDDLQLSHGFWNSVGCAYTPWLVSRVVLALRGQRPEQVFLRLGWTEWTFMLMGLIEDD